jgi:hypothetical protein
MDWLIAAVVGGIVLFLWTGLTQNFLPWGIKAVDEPKRKEDGLKVGSAIAEMTTNGMAIISEPVVAFVVVKPGSSYHMGRYFAIEFVTQLLVGAVLAGILLMTQGQVLETRLLLIALVGLAGVTSIDLQYWNWWGFSNRYTFGLAFNRLVGYLIAGGIVANFILR